MTVPKFGTARLAVKVEAYPPRDIGDLDNLLKPLLDALEHAGVFENDKQVDDLRITRMHPVSAGAVEVHIWEIQQCSRSKEKQS
jgi:crossover junction endodeoxyribonuclease RusA